MFTLLPEQHKKKLYKEYRLRLIVVVMFFVTSFFVVSVSLLYPSYISLKTEKSTLNVETQRLVDQIEFKNGQGINATIANIKSDLRLSKPDETLIAQAISAVLNERPGGVYIDTLRYTRGIGAPSTLSLHGTAKDRNALITFSNNLKKELIFSSVDLPISNLAKQADVDFSLTLIGQF